jgi:hypothetical protein
LIAKISILGSISGVMTSTTTGHGGENKSVILCLGYLRG